METEPKQTKNEKALAMVRRATEEQKFELFHDSEFNAWCSVPLRGHLETYKIHSKPFRLQIMCLLHQKLGDAPKRLVNQCLDQCEATAVCEGPMHGVHVRVATLNGIVYVDLGDDGWQVVAISADGWRILQTSPVKFRRPQGSLPLPMPEDGCDLRNLTKFMNVCKKDEILILAWLTYTLAGRNSPFPILSLVGEQGSGKSTVTKIMRSLIDPNVADLTTAPSSERDLAIAASKSHLLAFDNLSSISDSLSDALCRVATGGAFRTRELYTNDSEMLFQYRLPTVFNGIEDLASRPDLLDRSLLLHLEHIPDIRRPGFSWQKFEEARPYLFGALLDTVVAGLKNVDSVSVSSLPRMTEFAQWGIAVGSSLGFKNGDFLAAYNDNIADAGATAYDASPIASAVHFFMHGGRPEWRGTALKLLSDLRGFLAATDGLNGTPKELGEVLRNPKFPKSATELSKQLARSEPSLRRLGISFYRDRNHLGRSIHLRRFDSQTTATASRDMRHDRETTELSWDGVVAIQ
jgi:energy-coupling factor transporter ATP-binding protein EcfA2